MPPGRQPVPARQQPQPPIQPAQQLGHPQRLHPRRGQLDRQRHPVQPAHQPRHIGAVLIGQREPRIRRPGPVGEQRHRLRPRHVITRAGHRQRRQPVRRLARDPQPLPAGRQDPHVITGLQQARAQLRGRADHVLAVVQHHQQLPPGQHPRHRLRRGHPRLLPHPQRHRHHRANPRRIPHRGQLGQPRPVREPARHPPGHLAGQPGLAHPARPGHRHQPVLLQQARDLAHRLLPADKTRQHNRETMHASSGHARRRPLHPRTITAHSEPGTDRPKQRHDARIGDTQNLIDWGGCHQPAGVISRLSVSPGSHRAPRPGASRRRRPGQNNQICTPELILTEYSAAEHKADIVCPATAELSPSVGEPPVPCGCQVRCPAIMFQADRSRQGERHRVIVNIARECGSSHSIVRIHDLEATFDAHNG